MEYQHQPSASAISIRGCGKRLNNNKRNLSIYLPSFLPSRREEKRGQEKGGRHYSVGSLGKS
jgi:hypothetical protein